MNRAAAGIRLSAGPVKHGSPQCWLVVALALFALWGPVARGVTLLVAARDLAARGPAVARGLRSDATPLSVDDVRALRRDLSSVEQELEHLDRGVGPVLRWVGHSSVSGSWGAVATLAGDGIGAATGAATLSWWTALRLESALETAGQTNTASGVPIVLDTTPLAAIGQGLALSDQGLDALQVHTERLAAAVERLGMADGRVGRMLTLGPWLADVLRAAPRVLAHEGDSTWLVLIQNNDELRATGGFISSVAVVTLSNGRVANLQTLNSYDVVAYRDVHPDPPEALHRYMGAGMLLFRDANWSPDFPSSAAVLASIYAQDMEQSVDGVIAVDGALAQQVVAALGPLDVPGYDVQVTGDTVLAEAQAFWEDPQGATSLQDRSDDFTDWLAHRKDFTAALGAAVQQRLASASLGDWLRLAEVMQEAGQGKHLLVWPLTDTALQSDVRRMALDGAVAAAAGDYLMVVDSNVGWNKADRNISRQMDYRIDLSGEAPVAELCLAYRHNAPPQTGECEHRADYDDSYQALTERCYWDYWRVLVPAGTELLAYAGGEGGVQVDEEAGRTVFGGLLVVRPGETQTLCLRYQLLPETVTRQQTHESYRLTIQKQPGTGDVPVTLALAADGEWVAPGAAWRRDADGVIRLDDSLATDRTYDVQWLAPQPDEAGVEP